MIEIDARVEASGVPRCRDCYATWTTCSIPRLDPGATVSVRIDRAAVGDLSATDAGWLPVGTCIP